MFFHFLLLICMFLLSFIIFRLFNSFFDLQVILYICICIFSTLFLHFTIININSLYSVTRNYFFNCPNEHKKVKHFYCFWQFVSRLLFNIFGGKYLFITIIFLFSIDLSLNLFYNKFIKH